MSLPVPADSLIKQGGVISEGRVQNDVENQGLC